MLGASSRSGDPAGGTLNDDVEPISAIGHHAGRGESDQGHGDPRGFAHPWRLGASPVERLPTERAIRSQIEEFKKLAVARQPFKRDRSSPLR